MDTTLNVLITAYRMKGEFRHMERIHLSNHAMNCAHDITSLAYSLEDGNIDGLEEACLGADLVESMMPGEFILIDTGDYITADAQHRNWYGSQTSTYDPHHQLWLMPMGAWHEQKETLLKIDSEWRKEKQALANGESPEQLEARQSAIAKAQEIVDGWQEEWPEDDWMALPGDLGNDWDLNLYGWPDSRSATLHPVVNGNTQTAIAYPIEPTDLAVELTADMVL